MSPLTRILAATGLLCLPVLPAFADAPPESIPTASLHALDGMAPGGHWAARLTLLRNGYDQRYDDDGRLVALSGVAGLDTSVVTEYGELMFGYGVTGDLTVGAIVPWARTETRVHQVDPGVQALATGLGYQPLRTTASSGLGDPTLGALWRFHKSERDSAILGFGVRFGVSPADNPDNLLDVPPGDGSTDLRTRLEYFRDLGAGFDLRLLAEYQVQLADEVTMRDSLFSTTNQRLKRDLGDYWEYDIELGKSFGDWRVSATWHRYQEPTDRYTTMAGVPIAGLMANTDTLADQYRVSVTWSGVKAWQAGRLPMPLIVKLEMQDAFDGRNFVDVRDVYLRVTSFF